MPIDLKFPFILHGGDYNPDQWPEEVWDEDVRLMNLSGVNVATVPVFGWGNLQTSEDTWDFGWLDRVIEKLHAGGIRLCLATATAATPPWLDAKYPDILVVERDGRKRKHGSRHTFCPNSENFKRLSTGLTRKMAERYGKHPALLLWHVSNEYGNYCYCETCSVAFRTWLKAKYGTLKELNHRYNMSFWGQTYTDWSQVEAPQDLAQRNFQGLLIDYNRFQSESILGCCKAEIEVLREITPDVPITTNMMGTFKPLDYHSWAKELDIISWDSYPSRSAEPAEMAFRHTLMRGLKDGQPWMLMEQTPSQQNWQAYNSLKRPGVMRLWSYQAMAHGADAVMYFQWRRSPGAQEMFHGAVVEHAGRSDVRVFQEVAGLGAELARLGPDTLGGRVKAEAAIVFDWDAWWAVEFSSGPTVELQYVDGCLDAFRALMSLGITCDIVSVDADLNQYKAVIAPTLKMVKPGFSEKIGSYVKNGGVFVSSYFSGITDETDRSFSNGYPGPLQDILGVWIEETDALAPGEKNAAQFGDLRFECGMLCDLIRLEGASRLATYVKEFYAGSPCVTENSYGSGKAFYCGTRLDREGARHFYGLVADAAALSPVFGIAPPDGVEVTTRTAGDKTVHYVLNHNPVPVEVVLPSGSFTDLISRKLVSRSLTLSAYGVAVLK